MDAITERVLPGSGVHVQWRGDDGAWCCRSAADIRSERRGTAGWRPWVGDPIAIVKLAVVRDRQRWWVVAGELPSGTSAVSVETGDGTRTPVGYIAGRIWCCEWAGPPSAASITIGDRVAVTVDFRRRAHYLPGVPRRPEGDGPRRGWTSHTRPPPA